MARKPKSKKNKPLHEWAYNQSYKPYSQIAGDLLRFMADDTADIPLASRILYLSMLTNKDTADQRQNLYNALSDHLYFGKLTNDDIKLFDPEGSVSEYDLKRICDNPDTALFTFPARVAEAYGITPQHVKKELKPLIRAGMVEVFAHGVGGHGGHYFQTIYRFSNAWKKRQITKSP